MCSLDQCSCLWLQQWGASSDFSDRPEVLLRIVATVVPCTCLPCSSAEDCAVLTWGASGRWRQGCCARLGSVKLPEVLLRMVATVVPCRCLLCSSAEACAVLTWSAQSVAAAVRCKFGFALSVPEALLPLLATVVPCRCLLCSSAKEGAVLTWGASGRWRQGCCARSDCSDNT